MIEKIIKKSKELQTLNNDEIEFIIRCDNIKEICEAADEVKKHFFDNKVQFCSIINAKSGRCSEDCKFCAQSAHYNTESPVYEFIDLDNIEKRVKEYKQYGIKRFSIVTSGKSLSRKDIDKLVEGVKIVRENGLLADVSVGILDKDTLIKLKNAGLSGFHHNLETSRSYFKNVCTTHDYEEDVLCVKNAVELGFFVCSGGIFGIGENWYHRVELALTLKELNVDSIPLNFLNPIKGTPYEHLSPLSEDEALKIIALYRFLLPNKQIRVCGGRNIVFTKTTKHKILESGAFGIMVGDYLTVSGFDIPSDLEDIKKLNLKLV
ncbi:biotin synthase BioB [Deferribacter autotrophicus]|uniref:Biotin synthase n=1 Tax=Deferribacter autotrophicus TaxID=500465 RepID=A0A5A8F948_9BACT|nr:biotin synthase BioB [Deferribacter autotrophicus]KAA0259462.1 biotin synthase BioB [Deferribacter autotrophicus]